MNAKTHKVFAQHGAVADSVPSRQSPSVGHQKTNIQFYMKKYDHNKISKFLLMIFNLVLITVGFDQIFSMPDNDVLFIISKIILFIFALIVSGTMLAFIKPPTIKFMLWPIGILAAFLVIV